MSWLRRFVRWLEGPEINYGALLPKMPEDLEPRPRVGTGIEPTSPILTYRDPGIVLTGWNGAGVERAFVCPRCGALVAERRAHNEWHAR